MEEIRNGKFKVSSSQRRKVDYRNLVCQNDDSNDASTSKSSYYMNGKTFKELSEIMSQILVKFVWKSVIIVRCNWF